MKIAIISTIKANKFCFASLEVGKGASPTLCCVPNTPNNDKKSLVIPLTIPTFLASTLSVLGLSSTSPSLRGACPSTNNFITLSSEIPFLHIGHSCFCCVFNQSFRQDQQ